MCLVNQNIADIPVIVAAIDPCLSCTSRLTVVNRKDLPEVTVNRVGPGNGSQSFVKDKESR
jgi:hypothetical protein